MQILQTGETHPRITHTLVHVIAICLVLRLLDLTRINHRLFTHITGLLPRLGLFTFPDLFLDLSPPLILNFRQKPVFVRETVWDVQFLVLLLPVEFRVFLGVLAFFTLFLSAALLDLVPEADGDTL